MNILFLCLDMHNGFHGSFLHVMEYGEYFKSLGYEVSIGSVFISEGNRQIAENEGFSVYKINDLPLDRTWDIVYALHMFIFPALLSRGLKYNRAISATLSAFGGIELIPPQQLWKYFDLITAVSDEVVANYEERFDIKNIFTVIPNHIPLSFMKRHARRSWHPSLHKVAVISNHYVPELYVLSRLAPFKVELIGSLYNNIKRASADLLLDYDAIITIGKTVQFSLGLGIPIFEYDKFGGCGYITLNNLLEEEKTNFSGRGTSKVLSPREIIEMLENGYQEATASAQQLCHVARHRYDIRRLVGKQLYMMEKVQQERPPLKQDALLFSEGASSILDYMSAALEIQGRSLD